jgi:hypothetical protein
MKILFPDKKFITLKDKNVTIENNAFIMISLFNKCNLHCDFCFENKNHSVIDINEIKLIPDKLLNRVMTLNPIPSKINIGIMGGELFSDDIPDSMFEVYEELCRDIKIKLERSLSNLHCDFRWVSNGVYTKYDRIKKLLNNTNSNLYLSYDTCGRYETEEQKNQFFETTKAIKIKGISTALTKPNIYRYINDIDKFILSIPDEIEIDTTWYIASPNYKNDKPTYDDYFNFFKWVIDNRKYNLTLAANIINSKYHNNYDVTCGSCCGFRHTRYQNGIFYESGCINFYTNTKYYLNIDILNTISENDMKKIKNKIERNELRCISCKYYNCCMYMCWCNSTEEDDNMECPTKRIFQYIDDHNYIRDEYIQWKNKLEWKDNICH